MKVKIYKSLTLHEQEELFNIVKDNVDKYRNKEISYDKAHRDLKNGPRITKWLDELEDKEGYYNSFIPVLQKRLLSNYSKIIEPLIDRNLIVSNAGTELGLVRDGKIIKWDDDLDLLIDIKDFNRLKWKIQLRSILNLSFLWTRNWIKNNGDVYNKKNILFAQVTSLRRLKLDFGKFTVSYFPTIDIFPGIRVDSNISQNMKNEFSKVLFSFYKKYSVDFTDGIKNNKKLYKVAPEYVNQVRESSLGNEENIDKTIKKLFNNLYLDGSDYIYQLHVLAARFEIYDYNNSVPKIFVIQGKPYKFIISENSHEKLETEYGINWRTPLISHSHIFWLWSTKIKRKWK